MSTLVKFKIDKNTMLILVILSFHSVDFLILIITRNKTRQMFYGINATGGK